MKSLLPYMLVPLLLLLIIGYLLQASELRASPLLDETFDGKPVAGLASRLLDHAFITLEEGGGPDGSTAIRVAYEGYERGSRRVALGYPLPTSVEAATLAFDVRFDREFQWTLGGKLHGLGPAEPITGGIERFPEGWSARIMFNNDGRCSSYLYDQKDDYTYGTGDSSADPVFEKGKWHRVVLQVRLNAPGERDGFARVSVNNDLVVNTDEVMFRGEGGETTLIQNLLFNTFHGGSEPEWAPVDEDGVPTTVYAFFDNFTVYEGIIDPRHPWR